MQQQWLMVLFLVAAPTVVLCAPLSEIHTVTVTKAGKPVKVKPGIKHALPDPNEDLLDPETNLVESDAPVVDLGDSLAPPPPLPETPQPSFAPQTPVDPDVQGDEDDLLLLFPDRPDFVTGHRIPLELFSHETRERISGGSGRYVDSSNFRRGGSEEEEKAEKPSQEMSPPTGEVQYPKPEQEMSPPTGEVQYPKPEQEMRPPRTTTTTTTAPTTTTVSSSTTTESDSYRPVPLILEEGLSSEDDKVYREHIHAFVDY